MSRKASGTAKVMATAPAASALTRLTVRAWNFSAAVEGAEVVEVAEVEGAEGAWV
jgi:hypothetical protein